MPIIKPAQVTWIPLHNISADVTGLHTYLIFTTPLGPDILHSLDNHSILTPRTDRAR